MKATRQLHDLGQSLWLDNITRELLTAARCAAISATSRSPDSPRIPTIFDHAIRAVDAYDEAIRRKRWQANRARSCSSSSRWRT